MVDLKLFFFFKNKRFCTVRYKHARIHMYAKGNIFVLETLSTNLEFYLSIHFYNVSNTKILPFAYMCMCACLYRTVQKRLFLKKINNSRSTTGQDQPCNPSFLSCDADVLNKIDFSNIIKGE